MVALHWSRAPTAAWAVKLPKRWALTLTDGMRIELRSKGTVVTGVYAGFIDTDMAAEVSAEKVAPSEVANRLMEGIEDGAAHVCADEYSKALFATLFANPASVERDMQIAWDSDNAWSN
jgi:short-subunit dehydrogenase